MFIVEEHRELRFDENYLFIYGVYMRIWYIPAATYLHVLICAPGFARVY